MKLVMIFDIGDLSQVFATTMGYPQARVRAMWIAHLTDRISEIFTLPVAWDLWNRTQWRDLPLRRPDFMDTMIYRRIALHAYRPAVLGMHLSNVAVVADSLYLTFEE